MTKLDLKTKLFLNFTNVKIKNHIHVRTLNNKINLKIQESNKDEVYIFENYEEYKKFFLMYLKEIDEDVIDLAIYTVGKKGQIVAFKALCEKIIIRKKVSDFYNSITVEQIEKIHSKGKLTPLEMVQIWESNDLCASGNYASIAKINCDFFDYNCHECLLEQASHKLEHDNLDFKVTNSLFDDDNQKILKKTKI